MIRPANPLLTLMIIDQVALCLFWGYHLSMVLQNTTTNEKSKRSNLAHFLKRGRKQLFSVNNVLTLPTPDPELKEKFLAGKLYDTDNLYVNEKQLTATWRIPGTNPNNLNST